MNRNRLRSAIASLGAVALLLTCAPAIAAGPAATPALAGSTGVWAIDNDHHTVVFVPAAGGTPRPVMSGLTNPRKIVASRAGSVFVIDGTRLLKVNPRGVVTTIRTGVGPVADMAVDDNNWLFVRDGSAIVKYSPRTGSAAVVVGTGPAGNGYYLTVDAVGNASLTGPDPADQYDGTAVTTYPVRGGRPTVRTVVAASDPTDTFFRFPSHVVEARDGTIYLETQESGGSGASDIYRVPPTPGGPLLAYDASRRYSEYVFDVDAGSRFYLLQNRLWCVDPSRAVGECVDDYGVDTVQRYLPSGAGRVDLPVTAVDLPVGGIAVATSGTVYAAVLVSRSAGPTNDTAVPRLLRIDPAGGAAVVLAKGHFSMPVAENFLWYAG